MNTKTTRFALLLTATFALSSLTACDLESELDAAPLDEQSALELAEIIAAEAPENTETPDAIELQLMSLEGEEAENHSSLAICLSTYAYTQLPGSCFNPIIEGHVVVMQPDHVLVADVCVGHEYAVGLCNSF